MSFLGATVQEERDTIDGRDIRRYQAVVKARWGDREVDADGVASSDDDFFGRKNGQNLPLGEVDLNSVRKKAVTNAQARALKKMLGLGGLTWDDVKAGGVDRSKLGSVDYGKSKARKQDRTGASGAELLTLTRNMLLDLAGGDPAEAKRLCIELSSFTAKDGKHVRGKERPDDLSEAWLKSTHEKGEKAWEEWRGNFQPIGDPADTRIPGGEG
jgi:hypothetical protein